MIDTIRGLGSPSEFPGVDGASCRIPGIENVPLCRQRPPAAPHYTGRGADSYTTRPAQMTASIGAAPNS